MRRKKFTGSSPLLLFLAGSGRTATAGRRRRSGGRGRGVGHRHRRSVDLGAGSDKLTLPVSDLAKLEEYLDQANRLIREQVLGDPRLRYIDLTEALLGPDGLPERSLYRSDRLHPSKRGYEVWAAEIRSALEAEPALRPGTAP